MGPAVIPDAAICPICVLNISERPRLSVFVGAARFWCWNLDASRAKRALRWRWRWVQLGRTAWLY